MSMEETYVNSLDRRPSTVALDHTCQPCPDSAVQSNTQPMGGARHGGPNRGHRAMNVQPPLQTTYDPAKFTFNFKDGVPQAFGDKSSRRVTYG